MWWYDQVLLAPTYTTYNLPILWQSLTLAGYKVFSNTSWASLLLHAHRKCITLEPVLQDIKEICTNAPDDQQTVMKFKVWRSLLKVLGSSNSICPLLPTRQIVIADGLSYGMQLDRQVLAHEQFVIWCPVIANIALCYGGCWPDHNNNLLLYFILPTFCGS